MGCKARKYSWGLDWDDGFGITGSGNEECDLYRNEGKSCSESYEVGVDGGPYILYCPTLPRAPPCCTLPPPFYGFKKQTETMQTTATKQH